MSYFFIYYTEASVVCIIIFAIMLFSDLFSLDRQEKQIKYDHALVAYMLYFACDALWASIIAGALPRTHFAVLAVNFGNYVLMAAIAYTWLRYVMAVEHVPNRDSSRTTFAVLFPFLIATLALIATYLWKPGVLVDEYYNLQLGYSLFQIGVPCIYIAAILIYTMNRAAVEENPIERRKHLMIGLFPLLVVAGGLLQILWLTETPIFCFCCAILMIVFYINSLQTRISTDPLTGLNNRGQLLHYTLQKSNIRREGRLTFVIMFDINDFKSINDTYGHAEGDRALLVVADALRSVLRKHSMPIFLARYGGDEFILIVHPTEADEVNALIQELRDQIVAACRAANLPYTISIGAGFSRLDEGDDTFQACMQRADEWLYIDKARVKTDRRRSIGKGL